MKTKAFSESKTFQGIGDVVHVNVYESFTEKLDAIDEKLLKIEEFLNEDKSKQYVPQSQTSYTSSSYVPLQSQTSYTPTSYVSKNDEHAEMISKLKAQIAEATSEARRDALQQRLIELECPKFK